MNDDAAVQVCSWADAALAGAVGEGAFPGGVLCASLDGEVLVETAFGRHTYDADAPAVTPATVFDLASVTKVFVSCTVLALVADGTLALDDRLAERLPEVPSEHRSITLRHLLTHTAGLPSVPELHREHPTREGLRAALMERPLESSPGDRVAYTSLGYQYLGWVVERRLGMLLGDVMREAVLRPLGLERIGYHPDSETHAGIAPTEWSPVRRRLLQGEVHDENAALLGGTPGHTGLFATAGDVLRLGEAVLDGRLPGATPDTVFSDLTGGLDPARSAALVRDDPEFGTWDEATWSHIGFTGTSLLLVPERRLAAVLLTNRVQPTRDNERIVEARRRIHEALRRHLDGEADPGGS